MSQSTVSPAAPPSAHPYLTGGFAPVREEVTVTGLQVTGVIPEYLDGRYLRTGPNPVVDPDPNRYHWFLGDGMAHGLRLCDGRAVWYRNRWVRSAQVARKLGEKWPGGAHYGGFDFASTRCARSASSVSRIGPRPSPPPWRWACCPKPQTTDRPPMCS